MARLTWLALAGALGAAAAGAEPPEAQPCGACHGRLGITEQPSVPNLAGQQAPFLALQLILFREGLRDVPAMNAAAAGLSDAAIERLAAWFEGLPPAPAATAVDGRDVTRGAALAARHNCANCHGAQFQGSAQVPRLTGQHEQFLRETLIAYRAGARTGFEPAMNAAVQGMDDAVLADIAHFLARLPSQATGAAAR